MWKKLLHWFIDHSSWDAARWLWAAGGSGVSLAVQWIVGFIQGHQDLTATVITAGSMLFFGIVALVIHRNPLRKEANNLPIDGGKPESTKLTKTNAGTLTIHSAQWVSVERGSSRQAERFVREQIKEVIVDSVSFKLNNASLGGELPGAKDTHKLLKLSYSYGDDNPHEITKNEYDWLVLPEPPAYSVLQDQLIKNMEQESLRKEAIRATAWRLREGARGIKRNWPGADFVDRPANKDLWITVRDRHTPNDCDDRTWLDSAIRWYETFSASDAVKTVDYNYLRSLDFDELMEFLEFYEHEECGDGYALPLPFSAVGTSSIVPKVAIIRFEKRGNLQRYGAIVKNYSAASSAFEVRIQPLRIGRYRFSFADTVNTLSAEDGEVFIQAIVKAPDGLTIGFSVFDAMRERFKCEDDGFVPVNARVTFKDANGKRYACRQEFEQHVTNKESENTSVFVRRFEVCT